MLIICMLVCQGTWGSGNASLKMRLSHSPKCLPLSQAQHTYDILYNSVSMIIDCESRRVCTGVKVCLSKEFSRYIVPYEFSLLGYVHLSLCALASCDSTMFSILSASMSTTPGMRVLGAYWWGLFVCTNCPRKHGKLH